MSTFFESPIRAECRRGYHRSLSRCSGAPEHPSGSRSLVHVEGGKRASLGSVSFETVREAREESLGWLTHGVNQGAQQNEVQE